mmetsp:Transcript_44026/g.146761  ORF Transcript_44026/g.146761 Transcript_44026/m.146761 type:complete len:284 (+) Transcript_44026:711-1562(+)
MPLPRKPLEKFWITIGAFPLVTASRLPITRPWRMSWSDMRVQEPFDCAFPTLDAPGSLPTMSTSVRPETELVTLPPKASTIALTRALPSSRPAPPPTSGKIPVSTTVLPESELAGPSRPGTGTTKRFSPGVSATRAEPEVDDAARADEAAAAAGEAAGGAEVGLGALRLTRAAQLLLLIQWRVKADASSGESSPTPLRMIELIERSATLKRSSSAQASGSGRPSQTFEGTRQQPRFAHRPYVPVSALSHPTRRAPLGMQESAHFLADPLAEHLLRSDFAGSTR